MERFAEIRTPGLRELLRQDYNEMQKALGEEAPKSVVILAGGILEAILLDYLLTVEFMPGVDERGKKRRALKYAGLAELLQYASEGPAPAINKTVVGSAGAAAALCDGVQNMRNSVHPGRAIRGDGTGRRPDMQDARVAAMAVDLVAREVGLRALQHPLWAAEATLSFAEENPTAERRISQRIRSLSPADVSRLLVQMIPDRVLELSESGDYWEEELLGCWQCFCEAWDCADDGARQSASERTVELLQSIGISPPRVLDAMVRSLFVPDMLNYLSGEDHAYLLQRAISAVQEDCWLPFWEDIGSYLTPDVVPKYIDLLARLAVGKCERDREASRNHLSLLFGTMSDECRQTATSRLERAMDKCTEAGRSDLATELSRLRFRLAPLEDKDILG